MSRITTLTEEQKKLLSKDLENEVSTLNQVAATNKQTITNDYNAQISETEKDYNDLYDQNNVQRIINERRIAENMANLGLTDSGLNRTQQTAAQLSYANNQNRLSIAKQKAVEDLARVMNAKLSEIEIARAQNEQSIRSAYGQKAVDNATSIYNAEQDAAAKIQELQQDDYDKVMSVLGDKDYTSEYKQLYIDNYARKYSLTPQQAATLFGTGHSNYVNGKTLSSAGVKFINSLPYAHYGSDSSAWKALADKKLSEAIADETLTESDVEIIIERLGLYK